MDHRPAPDHRPMDRKRIALIAALCLLGSSLSLTAEPLLGRELRSAAVVEAMMPLCLTLQPDMAEVYRDIIAHWWKQNGPVRAALHELASGSSTPEGLEQQIAFADLVRQLQDDTVKVGLTDLAWCCAELMAGLATGREPAATPGGPCATET
jgi:hypothetical protein